jgi:hypothetical protein
MGVKKIRDEQPGSYFGELRNNFLENSLIRDRKNSDPGWEKFGSGINIPDLQHWLIKSISGLIRQI